MTQKDRRQVVIPKEKAVFWMDKNGEWFNEHGRFEHLRIIRYFNTSIKKDGDGYYVHQSTDEVEEKVYFKYEETALFAVDVALSKEGGLSLALNTGTVMDIEPENLYEKNDCLYLETANLLIKFTSRALLKISKHMKEQDGQLFVILQDRQVPVRQK